MIATWRPLSVWPYPPRAKSSAPFKVAWDRTIRDLGEEIERIGGHDVLIGIVADQSQFTLDGRPRAGFKVLHPGAEVSFDVGDRRLVFHTDAYNVLQYNLRAITLGLEALRAVDRYGITSTAEQYAGFAQLSAGGPDPERGRKLVDRYGSVAAALRATHPDTRNGEHTDRDFADVQAYKALAKVAVRG